MDVKTLFSQNKSLIILTLFWGLVQFSLLFIHGINTDGEARRFIQEANHLINHEPFSTPVYFMYLIEIMLVFIKLKFSFSYNFIIAIQLILNLAAVIVLKRFVADLFQSEKISFYAALMLIFCIPYQIFNSYIYTESIFYSISIIFSCYLLSKKVYHSREFLIIITGLVLLCLTRPTGIFFAAATLIWLLVNYDRSVSIAKKWMIFSMFSILLLIIINFILGNGQGVNVLTPFKEEQIICDVPTVIGQINTDGIDEHSVFGLVLYILKHPYQFIRLAILKTIAFFGLNRAYFSDFHNLFTNSYFYLIYILIITGILRRKKVILNHFLYHLSLVVIFWMAVVFSCDEWNNRFFLTLTPFLILMALPAISKIKSRE